MARVSIVTPVRNASAFLPRCVESVLAQTYPDWELLLADDGSRDGSFELSARFASRDRARIRVLHHPDRAHRGLGATRNLALRQATGEFIALLDPDDAWLPHKLARQMAELESSRPDVGMTFAQALCVDAADRLIQQPTSHWRLHGIVGWGPARETDDNAYEAFLCDRWYAPVATVMARARWLEAIGGFPEGMRHLCEDTVTWIRLARRARVTFIAEPLAHYRMHSANWSMRQTTSSILDARLEVLVRLARADGVDAPLARAYLRLLRDYSRQPRAQRTRRTARVAVQGRHVWMRVGFARETFRLIRRSLERAFGSLG